MPKGPKRFTKKKSSKITLKHHRNHKELEEDPMGKASGSVPTFRTEEFIDRQK